MDGTKKNLTVDPVYWLHTVKGTMEMHPVNRIRIAMLPKCVMKRDTVSKPPSRWMHTAKETMEMHRVNRIMIAMLRKPAMRKGSVSTLLNRLLAATN